MQIESFFPGRLRVRSSLFTRQENLDRIQAYIDGIEGIREVNANLRTGSLTVLYDAEVITMPMLMHAKDELERLEGELAG